MIWTLQSLFGQFFDATVGQMVNALSGARPGNRSSPWQNAPPPGRPALPPASRGGYPGESQGGTSGSPSAAPWQPATGSATIVVRQEPESRSPSPKDLDDDEIKLVKFGLVSIRRCHEKVLWGGVILVTTPMNSTSFASWIVAQYLQSPEYLDAVKRDPANAIAPADKKFLRVAWGVLTRWPREPKSGCGQSKTNALKGIRDAILDLSKPPRRGAAKGSSSPSLALPEPAAEGAGAPPEEPRAYETPPPEPVAPAKAAPVSGETLSTAGEIPAQTSESTALVPVEPAAPRRPRRSRQPQASAPPPEPPPEPRRHGRRPPPGEPRRRPR